MGNGERLALALLGALVLLPWIAGGGSAGKTASKNFESSRSESAAVPSTSTGSGPSWDASAFADAAAAGESALARLNALAANFQQNALFGSGDVNQLLQAALADRIGGVRVAGSDDGAAAGGGGAGSRSSGSASSPDFGIRNRDPSFARLPLEEFDPRDLAVLEEIIALNDLDESSSEFDFNDGDGRLDPRELGDQRWCNGRLRELRFGPDSFSAFGYEIKQLPPSVADLDGLMVLEANGVGLRTLPETVGQLTNLQRLSVYDNQLDELPESLGDSPQLQEIQARGNRIRSLPEAVAESASVQRVFVDPDRLVRVPERIEQQQAAIRDGSLTVSPRQIGPLGANCLPSS